VSRAQCRALVHVPARPTWEAMTLEHVRAELRALRASWPYAYAHAAGCTWGTDPRLAWVHERERRLLAVIRALQTVSAECPVR
jgi:hypothetical protein